MSELVEFYKHVCPECGVTHTYVVFPAPTALRIDCDCGKLYFWSRKQKKLYDGTSQLEMPIECMTFLGSQDISTVKALKV